MCLAIMKGDKMKIAKKDIICYKWIKPGLVYDMPYEELNGKEFTATFNGKKINGAISIHEAKVYFCTNNDIMQGQYIFNKHGYKYSWCDDGCVKDITINGRLLSKVEHLVTPYRKYPIEIGKTYTSDLVCNEYNEVEIGLHSFINKQDAFDDVIQNGFVVKCIIPKGSKYYEGTFDISESYASDCITYIEIV